VLLCHGFAGIKELLLPAHAERFQKAGFAALTFDYRGFGGSEGEPGRLVPAEQVTDIRNALRFLRSLPEVDRDRIALWGTSFGGANAVVAAAAEPSIRAVIVQLTFASGRRVILGSSTDDQVIKLTSTLARVLERAATRNQVLRMDPDQILSDPESKAFFARYASEYPALKTKIPLATVAYVLEYEPELVASRLSCPLLVIGATKDQVCPPEESQRLFELAPEPKRLVMLSCRHFDAYQGEAFEAANLAALHWLDQHLAAATLAEPRGAANNPGSA
jgi:fermentation-respiration switch protein FrsA (DUF1100 family)